MTNDFLFELGVEELPSALVYPLAESLKLAVCSALKSAQLSFESAQEFASPRRIALLITELDGNQPEQKIFRRGPALVAAFDANEQPTIALKKFAESCKVEIDALTISKTDKGEWLVYESVQSGVKTQDLLPNIIAKALADLPIPKPMRWGNGSIEFARPVHWVLMLWGAEVLACNILGTKAGNLTYGHRFMAPEAIAITKPKDYESALKSAFVIANFATRKALISEQIREQAKLYAAEAIMPESLVTEVTSIVEWPEALVANFEEAFLKVPSEALIAAMQEHQKCFALQSQGKLKPHFITISNLKSPKPAQVIAGNERVMRARLADAAFFYEQDQKNPLSYYSAGLETTIFQAKLGTLQDKTERIRSLMSHLAKTFPLDAEQAERAATLCKCDLLTGMVGEFPELQGIMGSYYAQNQGERDAVAQALYEQYYPRFAADSLPASPLGTSLSLADRIDTLVGIFGINQKPTGDKDPFKLRRHALAIVRILITAAQPFKISELISESEKTYSKFFTNSKTVAAELKTFILDRLYSHYQSQGITQDIIQAALARQSEWLYDLDARIKAIVAFKNLDEAKSLAAACKRVNHILQQANFKPKQVNPSLLEHETEKLLFEKLSQLEKQVSPLYIKAAYAEILSLLAGLRESVDAFFDAVMVMVDDPKIRDNRLNLLSQLQSFLMGTADISALQL